jgi:signal transduction histidine kinase
LVELPTKQIDDWIAGRTTRVDVAVHDLDDGMRSIECHGASQPGGWRNTDGSLWFPTAKGFVRIQPGLRRRLPPPEVVVEAAGTGGSALPLNAVRLTPGTRELEVRYTALRFGAPDHVRFRYRVEGADPDWIDTGAARSVRLPALPPGTYRLQLAARDEGGEWSPQPASLAIEQLPLFRQTLLFKMLMAAACAVIGAALYRWRIQRLRGRYAAVTEERNRIAREWHDTLLAGLSGISWQLEAARSRLRSQPEQAPAVLDVARKMVDHCAAEARRVIWDLRDAGPESPPLPMAIASFHRKLREGTAIEGVVETRGAYAKLPYDLEHNALRVAQEAIANAVRHAAASRIEVAVEYTAKQLMLQVSDNGNGFLPRDPLAADGHFGILGMRERVLSFGGVFEVASAPGAGTRVQARFPVSTEAEV